MPSQADLTVIRALLSATEKGVFVKDRGDVRCDVQFNYGGGDHESSLRGLQARSLIESFDVRIFDGGYRKLVIGTMRRMSESADGNAMKKSIWTLQAYEIRQAIADGDAQRLEDRMRTATGHLLVVLGLQRDYGGASVELLFPRTGDFQLTDVLRRLLAEGAFDRFEVKLKLQDRDVRVLLEARQGSSPSSRRPGMLQSLRALGEIFDDDPLPSPANRWAPGRRIRLAD